jgi:hypothetical protein
MYGAHAHIAPDMANGHIFSDEALRQQRLRLHDVMLKESVNRTLVLQTTTGRVLGAPKERTRLRIAAERAPNGIVSQSPESADSMDIE